MNNRLKDNFRTKYLETIEACPFHIYCVKIINSIYELTASRLGTLNTKRCEIYFLLSIIWLTQKKKILCVEMEVLNVNKKKSQLRRVDKALKIPQKRTQWVDEISDIDWFSYAPWLRTWVQSPGACLPWKQCVWPRFHFAWCAWRCSRIFLAPFPSYELIVALPFHHHYIPPYTYTNKLTMHFRRQQSQEVITIHARDCTGHGHSLNTRESRKSAKLKKVKDWRHVNCVNWSTCVNFIKTAGDKTDVYFLCVLAAPSDLNGAKFKL